MGSSKATKPRPKNKSKNSYNNRKENCRGSTQTISPNWSEQNPQFSSKPPNYTLISISTISWACTTLMTMRRCPKSPTKRYKKIYIRVNIGGVKKLQLIKNLTGLSIRSSRYPNCPRRRLIPTWRILFIGNLPKSGWLRRRKLSLIRRKVCWLCLIRRSSSIGNKFRKFSWLSNRKRKDTTLDPDTTNITSSMMSMKRSPTKRLSFSIPLVRFSQIHVSNRSILMIWWM